MSTVKPYKNHLIVHRHEGIDDQLFNNDIGLELPDSIKGKNQVSLVTDVGPNIESINPGDTVITKRLHDKLPNCVPLDDNKFLINLSHIHLHLRFTPAEEEDAYYMHYVPFGDMVLVKRLHRQRQTEGGIVIPENTEFLEQTKFSSVVSTGPLVEGLDEGDIVYHEWSAAIIELGLGGSSDDYFLLVPYDGIRMKYEGDLNSIDVEDRPSSLSEDKFKKAYTKKHKS